MKNNITIEIQYLAKNSQQLNSFLLSPNEYFDLEKNEAIELDCCPKYNHARDYLNNNIMSNSNLIQDLLFTKILLTDLTQKQHRQITERFWNNGNNKIIERIDMDLTKFIIIYNELIIETLINNSPPKWEIMRLNKEEGIMQPIFHSFIEDYDNNKQIENQIIIESLPLIKSPNQEYILS